MTFGREVSGREAAKRSGQARRRLTLEDVQEALGPLEREADAKRWLQQIATWCSAGLVSGSQGGASVRAVECWLRSHGEQLDRERLREAEKRVKELERELKAARGMTVMEVVR